MTRTKQILIAAAAFATLSVPAQAQLGGLIKKAAGKVLEDKAKDKVEEMKPEKPLEGDPITASSIDGVLKGLNFEVQQQAEAVRLKAIQEQKSEAWRTLFDAGKSESDAYQAKNEKILSCTGDALRKLGEKHGEEASAKIMSMV
jgi:hypothetical protein